MAIFTGTNANDSYLSTPEGDSAIGLAGNDTLYGNSGSDTLNGNSDDDLLFADSLTQTAGGNDSLFGGQGKDTLVGARFGFSADSLGGNRGRDLLIASTNGGNTLFGGQGNDTIYGSVQNGNLMNGSLGNDLLIAGRGSDRMLGADGNDTLIGGIGNNDMFGGEDGDDEFQFFTAVPGDLTIFTGAEQVIRDRGGFGGSDVINDFSTGDTINISELDRDATVKISTNSAGAAVIEINGTAGSSLGNSQPATNTITVIGVTREQLLSPGSQNLAVNGQFITSVNTANTDTSSTYKVGNGQSGGNVVGKILVGTNTADSFSPSSGIATSANGFKLVTTNNDDVLTGNDGSDFMDGGAGNDSIDGGAGADTLVGNTGIDTLTGGSGTDFFQFINFTPGEIDEITDYIPTPLLGGPGAPADVIQISASAFGGGLVAGGAPGTNFSISVGIGQPNPNLVVPTGIAAFYFDLSNGGGVYFDRDGGGTGTSFVKFARLLDLPLISVPITGGTPGIGGLPTIEIIA
jgi:Ca2+-binding RTX toxin-like protein